MAVVNGWYPKLRADGVGASGNAGVWQTPLIGGSSLLSPVGIGPIWAGRTLVYNRNDGTTQVGSDVILPTAYNEYRGSDDGQWAGFAAVGLGRVDWYHGAELTASMSGICAP